MQRLFSPVVSEVVVSRASTLVRRCVCVNEKVIYFMYCASGGARERADDAERQRGEAKNIGDDDVSELRACSQAPGRPASRLSYSYSWPEL